MDGAPINTDENGRDSKGRFTDGNNGKPKGATNKTTRDLKNFITDFLNDKAYEIPEIWNSMDDNDRATLYLHLCRLVLPKPTDESKAIDKNFEPVTINFVDRSKDLTPEQARQRAKELDDEY